MVLHNSEALGLAQFTKHSLRDSDDKLCWDFMILDEVTVADAEVLQHLTRLLNCDRGCWTHLLATQKCSYCMLRYVAAALFYVTKKIPQLALLCCGLYKAEQHEALSHLSIKPFTSTVFKHHQGVQQTTSGGE